jgi:hypothetical protein
VSIQTLKKQFQKELKTNPKKAGILGLLALVAIYFWAPLAMKMVSGGKKSSKSSKVVQAESDPAESFKSSNPESTNQPEASLQPVATPPAFGWDQIMDWIRQDPLTVSCPEIKNQHDPFKSVEKIIEIPTPESPLAARTTDQAPNVVRDLSPEALGMQLTSTIVGEQRSVAMIDNRAYALGQRVIAYDGATPLPFQLVAIRPELVILERDKQQYALKINQTIGLTVEDAEGL